MTDLMERPEDARRPAVARPPLLDTLVAPRLPITIFLRSEQVAMGIISMPEIGAQSGSQVWMNRVGLATFLPHPEMLVIPAHIQVFYLAAERLADSDIRFQQQPKHQPLAFLGFGDTRQNSFHLVTRQPTVADRVGLVARGAVDSGPDTCSQAPPTSCLHACAGACRLPGLNRPK